MLKLSASKCSQGACQKHLYVRMPDLLMSREEDLAAGIPESKVLKKYARYKVLVVDE